MVNRAAGEIYKTSSILAQTFGRRSQPRSVWSSTRNPTANSIGRWQTRRQPSPANSSSVWTPLPSKTGQATSLPRGSSRRPVGHGPWENWSTSRRPWPAD